MEAEIRIICVAFTGLVALAAASAQAAPNPNQQNWHPLGPPVTFGLGDETCGEGHNSARHDCKQALRLRDGGGARDRRYGIRAALAAPSTLA